MVLVPGQIIDVSALLRRAAEVDQLVVEATGPITIAVLRWTTVPKTVVVADLRLAIKSKTVVVADLHWATVPITVVVADLHRDLEPKTVLPAHHLHSTLASLAPVVHLWTNLYI